MPEITDELQYEIQDLLFVIVECTSLSDEVREQAGQAKLRLGFGSDHRSYLRKLLANDAKEIKLGSYGIEALVAVLNAAGETLDG